MVEIYRKRLVPQECIHLKKDQVLMVTEEEMVTRWDTINPKAAFSKGISLYEMKEGWKISKFYDSQGNFVYWYCDIIDTEFDALKNEYVFTDLLADVIVDSTGIPKVVDLDEFATALAAGLIDAEGITRALTKLDALLKVIYNGKFQRYVQILEQYE